MPNSKAQQSLHDQVVRAIAAQAVRHIALTNVDAHHPVHLGAERLDVSPDILFCDRENFLVEHAVEVELAATVSVARAQQWRRIARAVQDRGTFWLLVPPTAVGRASRLCVRYGIPARVAVWTLGVSGVSVMWARSRTLREPFQAPLPSRSA